MKIEQQTLALTDCQPLNTYDHCNLTQDDLPVRVSDVIFQHCHFAPIQAKNEFSGVTFQNCDLANLDFTQVRFAQCQFHNCRLLGADFTGSQYWHTSLTDCAAQMANFSETHWVKSQLQRCDFREAAFQAVVVKDKLVLVDCQLADADLTDTQLKGWDLSTATLDNCRLTPEFVAGVTIAAWQAAALIACFGVQVKS